MTQLFTNSRRLIALLCVAAMAAAISCGGSEEPEATAKPAAATIPGMDKDAMAAAAERRRAERIEGGPRGMRIKPEAGSDTIVLPDDFPSDVPIYPGASPTGYIASAGGRKMTTLVANETPKSAQDYYAGALEGQGWEIHANGASDELIMLSASKDGRRLAVAISVENDATTIKLIEGNR